MNNEDSLGNLMQVRGPLGICVIITAASTHLLHSQPKSSMKTRINWWSIFPFVAQTEQETIKYLAFPKHSRAHTRLPLSVLFQNYEFYFGYLICSPRLFEILATK